MSTLPPTAVAYFRTAEFTEQTVPEPLLHGHVTRAGVWARVLVTEGQLRYRTLDGAEPLFVADPDHEAIIPPQVPHRLEIESPARFRIELLRDEAVLPPLQEVLGDHLAVRAAS